MIGGSQPASNAVVAVLAGLALVALVTTSILSISDEPRLLTRSTVHVALLGYAAALCLFMRAAPPDWEVRTVLGSSMRWLWTWACVAFLLHVACAFHFVHGWSHDHAFEQTRRESGVGEGLWVNYLFMLAWAGDVAWWWISSMSYARRPRGIDRALHGFLLFIAFNATVVFEAGAVRWAGLIGFVALAVMFCRRRMASMTRQ